MVIHVNIYPFCIFYFNTIDFAFLVLYICHTLTSKYNLIFIVNLTLCTMKIKLTKDIFSGRRNPTIILDGKKAADLLNKVNVKTGFHGWFSRACLMS